MEPQITILNQTVAVSQLVFTAKWLEHHTEPVHADYEIALECKTLEDSRIGFQLDITQIGALGDILRFATYENQIIASPKHTMEIFDMMVQRVHQGGFQAIGIGKEMESNYPEWRKRKSE